MSKITILEVHDFLHIFRVRAFDGVGGAVKGRRSLYRVDESFAYIINGGGGAVETAILHISIVTHTFLPRHMSSCTICAIYYG